MGKSKKVGFVGGMDIPLIRKFQCGYEQGAKYINPKIDVYQNMTGSTPAAFADPAKGAELAKSQFAKGADVVYAAAGGTGIGVYQAAKDEGKPEQAIAKIVEGRVNAYFKDTVLLEQPSVVDGKKSVSDVLAESGTTVRAFARFEPGQA